MYEIVMSEEFFALDKPLMVEIIRRRFNPSKAEVRIEKIEGNRIGEIVYEIKMIPFWCLLKGTTLENDMAVFLKTGGKPFCDINLVLDGHIIPAHMSIMLARSAYFQGMFRSFMPTDNSVKVKGFAHSYIPCYITQYWAQSLSRSKLVIFHHRNRRSIRSCASSTTVTKRCHPRTPYTYSRHPVFMVCFYLSAISVLV